MAKGLRSKSKRRFRTLKRQNVVQTPWQIEADEKKQEALAAVLAAPKPSQAEGGGDGAGPAAMEGLQAEDAAMAVDGHADAAACPNPSKLKRKLRQQRLATTKGIVKGQAKKSNPLAGANQFHKKKGKKRR